MRSTLVYDLPTRIFHWLFAGLFLTSFIIGKTIDDESLLFSYHMLSGILLSGLVLWRVFWGVFGARYARFSSYALNPIELKDYFSGLLTGSKKRWVGHNPASSWAAILMFVLALGLGLTGYLMSTGNKETFEDLHEILANTFIIVVVLHIAGVLLHTIRHQDLIALSMVDGKKQVLASNNGIQKNHSISAVILIILVVFSGFLLNKNFNDQDRTLKIFGTTLQLGENEEGENEKEESEESRHEKNTNIQNQLNNTSNDEDGDDD